MIVVWVIGVIVVGIVLLGAAYNLFWVLVEAVHPFTYRQVPLDEVHDHILAIFRRGLKRSQMLITCEQNGKQLRFCKTYKYGQQGITFHLIVPVLTHAEPGLSEAITGIEALGLRYNVTHQNRNFLALDVDCLANVDKAKAVADIVMASIVHVSATSTFSVRVKGGIMRLDRYMGGETRLGDIVSGFRVYDEGKPYDWAHYCTRTDGGTLAKSLGAIVGRVVASLFPPRK